MVDCLVLGHTQLNLFSYFMLRVNNLTSFIYIYICIYIYIYIYYRERERTCSGEAFGFSYTILFGFKLLVFRIHNFLILNDFSSPFLVNVEGGPPRHVNGAGRR